MKNFPVKKNGRQYWISRSIATVSLVYGHFNGKWHILANQRGIGLPNNVGKWNCPSGYLDYNETIRQCAAREIHEETGIYINEDKLELFAFDDSPKRGGNQIVMFQYWTALSYGTKEEAYKDMTDKYSEPNEVMAIEWIPIDRLDDFIWVSEGHKARILREYETIKYAYGS